MVRSTRVPEAHGLVAGALDCRCVKVGDGTMTAYVDMLGGQAHTTTASDTNQSFAMASLQHIAPTCSGSMSSTTRGTVIGGCNEPVDATKGGITMDLTCESGAGSAGGAAACGTQGAAKAPPLCKLAVLDLEQYYETHDPTRATDENCNKLLSKYSDEEILESLQKKYKAPLRRVIDLTDF